MPKKPTQRNPSKGSPVETQRLQLALRLMGQLNSTDSPAELLPILLSDIQSFTGFAAVSLRLKPEENTPDSDTSGFLQTLVIPENHGAKNRPGTARCLEDICSHVLSGRPDPHRPGFSAHGSFWTNDIQNRRAHVKLKDSMGPLTRQCMQEDYRTLALIPLQAKDRVIGLLQLSDSRTGLLDEGQIRFLEKIGEGVGGALARMGWNSPKTDHRQRLQKKVDRRTEELVHINEELRKEIEDRRRVEEELRESREQYRALFHNSPFRTVIVDRDGRITAFHPGTLKTDDTDSKFPQIGRRMYTSDFAGRHAIDMRGALMSVIESGQARTFDDLVYDDRYLSVIISPFSQGAIITTFDVTDRKLAEAGKKKFEAQMLQAQKLEAVGTLAGGIAHDFNNILWIITGNTELAAGTIDKANPAQHNLKRIEQASQRAKDLVSQILSFSRQSPQEKRPLKISAIVKESLKLMRASLPATIDIRQNMPADAPTILADLSQINQVIVNLCTNAAHAMRERGGILNVSLMEIELDEDEAARHQDLAPGKYAILSVMDTGHGITAENMDRIFDPFYSTKQINEGIGMGLSVIHGIVKDHGGAITVHSKPDAGSTFHVLLPTVEKEKPGHPQPPFDAIPKGTERILYVDDDQELLDMGESILRRLGYRVTATPSPVEALAWVKNRPDRFDLVITDQTMPRMTGEKLSRKLLAIQPALPIILCTGYSELIDEKKAAGIGIRAFLLKPVVMEKLAKTIRRVLDFPLSPEPAAPMVPSDKTN